MVGHYGHPRHRHYGHGRTYGRTLSPTNTPFAVNNNDNANGNDPHAYQKTCGDHCRYVVLIAVAVCVGLLLLSWLVRKGLEMAEALAQRRAHRRTMALLLAEMNNSNSSNNSVGDNSVGGETRLGDDSDSDYAQLDLPPPPPYERRPRNAMEAALFRI